MTLRDLLDPNRIRTRLAARDRAAALAELVDLLAADPEFAGRRAEIADALAARERAVTTAIGRGVAIPHAELATPIRAVAAVGVSADGVEYDAPDGKPVHIVFLMVVGKDQAAERIEVLSTLSRMMRQPNVRDAIRAATTPERIIEILSTPPAR